MNEVCEESPDDLEAVGRPRSSSLPSKRTNLTPPPREREVDSVLQSIGPYRTPEQPRDRPSILKHQELKSSTIRQHYYPEGGWGWVICACAFLIHCMTTGLQLSYGILYIEVLRQFGNDKVMEAVWTGSLSLSCSYFIAPIVVAFCRRKSTRLTAVFGGLASALGCLFNSFAKELHQVIFSYGIVMAVGLGVARETSNLMIGQYFKRKRERVELVVQCGTGVGVAVFSVFFRKIIRALGWRLGLHTVTGVIFLMFFIGIFYRSASLYHPQRRAILHLKNQRRKIKEKSNSSDKPPFFDFSVLKVTTIQIVMLSTAVATFGAYTPFYYFAYLTEEEGLNETAILLLQSYLGVAFSIGCLVFGFLTAKNSMQCMISRQYLCQASLIGVGLSILSSHAVHGYHGYVLFVSSYGIFCGGFHYSLKMFVFENVRARNFARAWGYVQCCQFLPILVGIPITGYSNQNKNPKTGFFFSAACTFAGAIFMFLLNCCKRSSNVVYRDQSQETPTDSGPGSGDDGICTCHQSPDVNRKVARKDGMAREPFRCHRTISFAHSIEVMDEDDELDRRQECVTCMGDDAVFELGMYEDEWKEPCKEEYQKDHEKDQRIGRSDCIHLMHCDNILHIPKRPMSIIEEVTSTV